MPRQTQDERLILNAAAANGVGTTAQLDSYRHLQIDIRTASSANVLIRAQASFSDDEPNFAAAASGTNRWGFVAMVRANDATGVNGDVGVQPGGTDLTNANSLYYINMDGIKWLNFQLSSYVAGNVSVRVKPFND